MAYIYVSRSSSGEAALAYLLEEKAHNGAQKRNEIVSCVNMFAGVSYKLQMKKCWDKARKNHTCQVIKIIISFSKKELSPDSEIDIHKANEIGRELVKSYYPGRQALICTQTDGKGGNVHNHIVINDVSLIDNKGCSGRLVYQPYIWHKVCEITSNYTDLYFGNKDNKTPRSGKTKYPYKDELRKRVKRAMAECDSEENFFDILKEDGVIAKKNKTKKFGEFYTYKLVDIPKDVKIRFYTARSHTLGEGYGVEDLQEQLNAVSSVKNDVREFEEFELRYKTKKHSEPIKEQSSEIDPIPDDIPLQDSLSDFFNNVRIKLQNNISELEKEKVEYEEYHEKHSSVPIKNDTAEKYNLNLNMPPISCSDLMAEFYKKPVKNNAPAPTEKAAAPSVKNEDAPKSAAIPNKPVIKKPDKPTVNSVKKTKAPDRSKQKIPRKNFDVSDLTRNIDFSAHNEDTELKK